MKRLGDVAGLWRYPVKSMIGEPIETAAIGPGGVAGDRARAVVDAEGCVGSAKHSKRWPGLYAMRAAYLEEPEPSAPPPPVGITLPGGARLGSDDAALDATLSDCFGRTVALLDTPPPGARAVEERDDGGEESFALPPGTFFDDAALHLLSVAALDRLGEAHPSGRFAPERFRPNVLIATDDRPGFPEDGWIGRCLQLGDELEIVVTGRCRRCVMVSLEQEDRPRDPGILRTAAELHGADVGVYARVVRAGRVRLGDPADLLGAVL
jgi:uncharacterized protein YcbX